jgi:hypothetical protein
MRNSTRHRLVYKFGRSSVFGVYHSEQVRAITTSRSLFLCMFDRRSPGIKGCPETFVMARQNQINVRPRDKSHTATPHIANVFAHIGRRYVRHTISNTCDSTTVTNVSLLSLQLAIYRIWHVTLNRTNYSNADHHVRSFEILANLLYSTQYCQRAQNTTNRFQRSWRHWTSNTPTFCFIRTSFARSKPHSALD